MLQFRTMSILRSIFKQELVQFIRDKFPVERKRSAFWFFTNEFKNSHVEETGTCTDIPYTDSKIPQVSEKENLAQYEGVARSPKKVSRNRMMQIWRNMIPESKRKYFNMAEFDEVRYEEQKSLWISEVGALLRKYKSIDLVSEMAPTHEDLQNEFLKSLDQLHKDYEQMIQTESTKMLYKDAIKCVNLYNPSLATNDLVSALPRHHNTLLSKPRRPPTAFALFMKDNVKKYAKMRESGNKDTHLQMASKEWAGLDRVKKREYEEIYHKLKEEYDQALASYRLNLSQSSDDYLELASREKKAFRKSLRRRLRKSSVLPLSIRNPFNFFVMEHKDSKLSKLTETWRNLNPEQKQKYVRMTKEDAIRYQHEIEAYNAIKKSLSELVGKTRKPIDESSI